MAAFKNRISYDLRLYLECFPHIERYRRVKIFEMMSKSVISDNMFPEELDKHDKMFEPRNEYEKLFWESFRAMAKQDMKNLVNAIENGKKGGRPPLTSKEKEEILKKSVNSVGSVGKNEIFIDDNFNSLPDCEYFAVYKKEFSASEIKNCVDWIKKTQKYKKVDYEWIGKQIQNFKKRKTGKIF